MKKFQPAIKWCGSKRSQAIEIVKEIPEEIDTYYEPFCGGCSILRAVIESGKKVNHYVCSDKNGDLIVLWDEIKKRPNKIIDGYQEMWEDMIQIEDRAYKKEYYNMVRDRYNEHREPVDFLFIMRTCMNGMPRYNKKGEFNNSFHITRDGVRPETLRKVLREWSEILREKDVVFQARDYREIQTDIADFLYLDPPYAGTKGIYYGGIELEELWTWIGKQHGRYIMSFDGVSGDIDNTYTVPKELYREHKYIESGKSSFKRIVGKGSDSMVKESLYIK